MYLPLMSFLVVYVWKVIVLWITALHMAFMHANTFLTSHMNHVILCIVKDEASP